LFPETINSLIDHQQVCDVNPRFWLYPSILRYSNYVPWTHKLRTRWM